MGCRHTKSAAIIDSGEVPSAFFAPCALQHSLQVKHLLQTHAHIDHVLGLKATKELYPEAPLYMHRKDLPSYSLVEKSSKTYGIPVDFPLPLVDVFLQPSAPVQVGRLRFQVIFTPGHAPGHCVFYCQQLSLAFVGDLLFRGSVGRTDLPHSSPEDMKKSVQRVVEELPSDTLLLCGHGETTTMAAEKASNPFVREWCCL